LQADAWSVFLFARYLLDDDTVTWGQSYQGFSGGRYRGSIGGDFRDESVMAFLPDPRLVGVCVNWKYGA